MIEKNGAGVRGGGIMNENRELDGIRFLFPVGEKTPEKGQKSGRGRVSLYVHPA